MIHETFKKSDYFFDEKKKSLIDPTKEVVVKEGVICPRCKAHIPDTELEHGFQYTCTCGLFIVAWGDSLMCSLNEKLLRKDKLNKINKI